MLTTSALKAANFTGQMPESEKKETSFDPSLGNFTAPQKMTPGNASARKLSGKPGVLRDKSAKKDTVYEIIVQSTNRVDPDAVIPHITSQVGMPLNRSKVADDIRQIYAIGLIENVVVERTKGPNNSIILIYQLSGKKILHSIKVKGAKEIEEDDVIEALTLKEGHVADVSRILENLEKIRQKYIEKGFYLVKLGYELKPVEKDSFKQSKEEAGFVFGSNQKVEFFGDDVYAPDLVNLEIIIDEQAKVRIEDIHFLGNKTLSTEALKAHIRSREIHPMGIMTKWGTFSEEMLDIDLLMLENYYQDHGFLEVKIGKPRVTLSADKNRISVYITIVEGNQYRIGEVAVQMPMVNGKKLETVSEASIRDYIELKKGELFSRTSIALSLQGIADLYKDEGYAFANVDPLTSVHEEKRIVDLNIQIDPGEKVYIERIEISGNDKTIDDVIRREMRIYEGELYSSSMLRLSEMRITQLGYFESVKLSQRMGSSSDKLIIEVNIVEKSTGQIQGGLGYGSGGEGVLFNAQVSQQNLFGRGQVLSANVSWSSFRRIFDIRFIDPYAIDWGKDAVAFSFSAYNTRQYMGLFSRESTGGDVTFGYTIGKPLAQFSRKWIKKASRSLQAYVPDFDNFKLFLTYNLERVHITDPDIGVRLADLHIGQPRYTSSLRSTFQFDQRNNRLFPTQGFFWEFQLEVASGYLGSYGLQAIENKVLEGKDPNKLSSGNAASQQFADSNSFFRLTNNFRFYYSPGGEAYWEKIILKANFNVGYLNAFEGPLVFENFMLGGMGTIRGYYFRSIGPLAYPASMNPVADTAKFNVGGNKQFFANFEAIFPLVESVGLSAVLFFDMGNTFGPDENWFYAGNNPKSLSGEVFDPIRDLPLGMYYSVGFGLRWMSPMGLLRIEWGIPLVRRPAGARERVAGDGPIQFDFSVGTSF